MIIITPLDENNNALDQALQLEATISENHSFQNEITSHPRENTTDVSDNIIRKPRVFTASCVISDDTNATFGGGAITDIFRGGEIEPYSFEMWNMLKSFAEKKYPLAVDTSLEYYYPLYIEDISDVVRDVKYSKALKFNITFREVIQIESALVDAPKKTKPVNSDKTTGTKNSGTVKKQDPTTKQSEKYHTSAAKNVEQIVVKK